MNSGMAGVWIGMVGVSCLPGDDVFGGNQGAFVTALAPAKNAAEFHTVVTAALGNLQLIAVEFEDVQPFGERERDHGPLDVELTELRDEAHRTGAACFSTFHTYPHEDA